MTAPSQSKPQTPGHVVIMIDVPTGVRGHATAMDLAEAQRPCHIIQLERCAVLCDQEDRKHCDCQQVLNGTDCSHH